MSPGMAVGIVLWLLVSAVGIRVAAAPPQIQEIEEALTCQCGCGLTVHSCNHVDCSSAIPLRKEVRELIAAGKSREEILRHFVDKYGEKILSSPTFQGFNLLAWVAPFALLVVGGTGLFWLLHRWQRRPPVVESSSAASEPEVEAYRDVLEKELRRLEE